MTKTKLGEMYVLCDLYITEIKDLTDLHLQVVPNKSRCSQIVQGVRNKSQGSQIVLKVLNKSGESQKVPGDPNSYGGPKKLQFAAYWQFVLDICYTITFSELSHHLLAPAGQFINIFLKIHILYSFCSDFDKVIERI